MVELPSLVRGQQIRVAWPETRSVSTSIDQAGSASADSAGAEGLKYDYDAFISYRRRDASALARWIRDRLQHYRLPPEVLKELAPQKKLLHERRPRIWLDRAFEKPSDDFLTGKVYPALDRSARLIVVSSPSVFDAIRARDGNEKPNWLVREIDRFLGGRGVQNLQRPVDIVLGPGGDDHRFPGRLAERERWDWIDCRRFSWWRSLGLSEELDVACTKLVAGLYDVPETQLPALRQEEHRRRNRRLLGISAGTTTVSLLIGVLGLVAWQQQHKATRNAAIADARRLTAEAELIISQQPARTGVGVLLAAQAIDGFRSLNLDSPDASEMVRRGLAFLPRIEGRLSFRPLAHTVSRYRAVFAKGGQHFAISANDSTVQLLDPKISSRTRTLNVDAPISYLAFSADGRFLLTATGTNDRANPAVWDITQEQPKKIFEKREVFNVAALSSDGQYLMLSANGSASVWSTTADTRCSLPSEGEIQAAEFSPDKAYLAESYWGPTGPGRMSSHLALFDASTCRKTGTIATRGPTDYVTFSPDSKYIAAASGASSAISAWEVATGRIVLSGRHSGGNGIDNISFSPSGAYLVSSGYDLITRVWELKTGTEVSRIPGSGLAYQVDFSPDEKYVLTVFSGENVVRVWTRDTSTEVARLSHGAPLLKAAFSPDGARVITADSDGFLRIWVMPAGDAREHELVQQIQAVSISVGGRYLASLDSADSSDEPPVLHVFDFAERKEIFTAELPSGAHEQIAIGSTNRRGAAVSSDGKRAAAVGYWNAGHVGYVWDTETKRLVFHEDGISSIDSLLLSPDGRYLATVIKGVGNLSPIDGGQSLRLAQFPVQKLDFSGDSKHIGVVVPGAKGDSCLEEQLLPTGHRLHVLKIARTPNDIAISNRGRLIAITNGRGVGVWDLAACRLVSSFDEKERITALAFDEAEELLAAATAQGSAQIWRLRTKEKVYRVHHDGYLATLAFGRDKQERYLLTANGYVTRYQGELAPNPINSARLSPWQQKDVLANACRILNSYSSKEFPQDLDFDAAVRTVCQSAVAP